MPRKESVPPDVAAAAARKRVEKLEAVLVTLGEDDDIFPVIRARAQAQVRPVSERIQACKSFLERARKRVEFARQTIVKARESLAEAVAAQEKQEALLADGEQMSQLSRGEEQSFSFHCSTSSSGRFCRVESHAGCHQRSTKGVGQVAASSASGSHDLRRRVNGVGPRPTISLRVDVGVDRRGPREAPPSHRRGWDRCETAGRSPRVHARYGLRGSRIGEASNAGPSFLRLRRSRLRPSWPPSSSSRICRGPNRTKLLLVERGGLPKAPEAQEAVSLDPGGLATWHQNLEPMTLPPEHCVQMTARPIAQVLPARSGRRWRSSSCLRPRRHETTAAWSAHLRLFNKRWAHRPPAKSENRSINRFFGI